MFIIQQIDNSGKVFKTFGQEFKNYFAAHAVAVNMKTNNVGYLSVNKKKEMQSKSTHEELPKVSNLFSELLAEYGIQL